MLTYIKPKIILLDDDQSLLDVIHYYFTEQFKDSVIVKTFSKSKDCLTYLEKYCYLPDSPMEILYSFYESDMNKALITKTLKDLSELSAIIVLDQELRGESITGIDISATIREYFPASYISMLTSNVSNSRAIQLHNNHNIDLFIDKKDTDAIHNLYTYLAEHIDTNNNQYALDSIDIFPNSTIIESNPYVLCKKALLKQQNPLAFLTLNANGDIAISQDNEQVSFWQYNSKENNFIAYEY
ncbi:MULTISPECIES: hypothetical protein [unclassified Legionella]|uniref:hypothetical protein n=1 Tax=unclassified Legionella TaxID=2622702 RepID=UPI001055E19C|nr:MULTISPECIES: hypothetical protein [unclassified Legionella]MDI9818517.1 hypothetical protein [Legionella sp. PL877]